MPFRRFRWCHLKGQFPLRLPDTSSNCESTRYVSLSLCCRSVWCDAFCSNLLGSCCFVLLNFLMEYTGGFKKMRNTNSSVCCVKHGGCRHPSSPACRGDFWTGQGHLPMLAAGHNMIAIQCRCCIFLAKWPSSLVVCKACFGTNCVSSSGRGWRLRTHSVRTRWCIGSRCNHKSRRPRRKHAPREFQTVGRPKCIMLVCYLHSHVHAHDVEFLVQSDRVPFLSMEILEY
jgi:hypothetical protein